MDPLQLIQSLTSQVTSRGSNICRRTANFTASTAKRTANFTASALGVSSGGSFTASSVSASSSDVGDGNGSMEESSQNGYYSSRPSLCYEDTDSEDDEMSFYDYDDDFSNHDHDDDGHLGEQMQNQNPTSNGTVNTHNSLLNQSTDFKHEESAGDADARAIQFELSITFQGRNYTATRAFSRFVKLRNDLLRENGEGDGKECMQGGGKQNKFYGGGGKQSYDRHNRNRQRTSGNEDAIFKMYDMDSSNPQTTETKIKKDCEAASTVSIPELPTVSPENYGGHNANGNPSYAWSGVACRGFAYLQATAKLYGPEMEKWLRHVIVAVPCSPSLSHFLWEPLASSSASWDTPDNLNVTENEEFRNDGDNVNDGNNLTDNVQSQEKKNYLGTASNNMSPFPPRNSKSRSTNPTQGGRFISKGSVGSLNSIEEGDDDKSEEDT